jgi:glycyl-tRNA synthetase (class II)
MVTKLIDINRTKNFSSIELEHFYSEIKNANYKSEVDFYRLKLLELGKKNSEPFKQKLPAVVISGTFNESVKNANLKEHSGYICVDIDNIESNNIKELKLKLRHYKYV